MPERPNSMSAQYILALVVIAGAGSRLGAGAVDVLAPAHGACAAGAWEPTAAATAAEEDACASAYLLQTDFRLSSELRAQDAGLKAARAREAPSAASVALSGRAAMEAVVAASATVAAVGAPPSASAVGRVARVITATGAAPPAEGKPQLRPPAEARVPPSTLVEMGALLESSAPLLELERSVLDERGSQGLTVQVTSRVQSMGAGGIIVLVVLLLLALAGALLCLAMPKPDSGTAGALLAGAGSAQARSGPPGPSPYPAAPGMPARQEQRAGSARANSPATFASRASSDTASAVAAPSLMPAVQAPSGTGTPSLLGSLSRRISQATTPAGSATPCHAELSPQICPTLIIHEHETTFSINAEKLLEGVENSLRLEVTGSSGKKMLHIELKARGGRQCLGVSPVGSEEDPRCVVYGPTQAGASMQVFARGGKFFGVLQRSDHDGGDDRVLDLVKDDQKVMTVEGNIQYLNVVARQADGSRLASAQVHESMMEGIPQWKLQVGRGVDSILVISSALALLLLTKEGS